MPKWSLTQSFLTKGGSSFQQASSLTSRAWVSWGPALALKTEAKKTFSNCLLCILCVQDTHLVQQQPHIVPSLPFAAAVLEEAFLLDCDIPCQIQFHVDLSLPRCIPACSGNIPVLFPSGLSLFQHSTRTRHFKVTVGDWTWAELQGSLPPWGSTLTHWELFEVNISLYSRAIFNRCLYLCILSVCMRIWIDSNHDILLLWLY